MGEGTREARRTARNTKRVIYGHPVENGGDLGVERKTCRQDRERQTESVGLAVPTEDI